MLLRRHQNPAYLFPVTEEVLSRLNSLSVPQKRRSAMMDLLKDAPAEVERVCVESILTIQLKQLLSCVSCFSTSKDSK